MSNHLNFACNLGLIRTPCSTCKAETLHKHGKCVHCAGEMVRRKPAVEWSMDDVITRQATLAKARAPGIRSRRLAGV